MLEEWEQELNERDLQKMLNADAPMNDKPDWYQCPVCDKWFDNPAGEHVCSIQDRRNDMISPFVLGFLAGVFVTAVAVAIAIKADERRVK